MHALLPLVTEIINFVKCHSNIQTKAHLLCFAQMVKTIRVPEYDFYNCKHYVCKPLHFSHVDIRRLVLGFRMQWLDQDKQGKWISPTIAGQMDLQLYRRRAKPPLAPIVSPLSNPCVWPLLHMNDCCFKYTDLISGVYCFQPCYPHFW